MPNPFARLSQLTARQHHAHRVLLQWTAWAETVTLVALLVNLATAQDELVTSGVGPVHGGLYLLCSGAIVLARSVRGWSWLLVLLGVLPAVGAVIALEKLRREARSADATTRPEPPGRSGSAQRITW